jgi:hypothetical protein
MRFPWQRPSACCLLQQMYLRDNSLCYGKQVSFILVHSIFLSVFVLSFRKQTRGVAIWSPIASHSTGVAEGRACHLYPPVNNRLDCLFAVKWSRHGRHVWSFTNRGGTSDEVNVELIAVLSVTATVYIFFSFLFNFDLQLNQS